MKKHNNFPLLLIITILISSCTYISSNRMFQLYENQGGMISWAGIVFGVDTLDETKEKLESLDFIDPSSIKVYDYYVDGGTNLTVSTVKGVIDFHFTKNSSDQLIVVGMTFDAQFKAEQVFEMISEPERVFIGIDHSRRDRRIVLINKSQGYILSGLDTVKDVDDSNYLLTKNGKYVLYLFSPKYLNLFLSIGTSTGPNDLPEQEYFQKWNGYVEYNVYEP